jgi:hypothetical protein
MIGMAPTADQARVGRFGVLLSGLIASLYVAHLATAILSNQVLFLDGVHYFLTILQYGHPRFHESARVLGNIVTQSPVAFGVLLGLRGFTILGWLLGIGVYLPAPLSLLVCAWSLGPRRWHLMAFPLLSQFAFAMSSSFIIVGEHHLMHSLFWAILFMVLFREQWGWREISLMTCLAIPALRTYPSMLFLGPILAGACVWRARRRTVGSGAKWSWGGLAGWFSWGTAIALGEILHPRDPANWTSFRQSLGALTRLRPGEAHLTLFLSLACCALVVLLAIPSSLVSRLFPVLLGILALCGVAVLAAVLHDSDNLAVLQHYPARIFDSVGPVGLALALIGVQAGLVPLPEGFWRRCFAVIAVLAVVQIGWHLAATRAWVLTMAAAREELQTRSGFVPFSKLAAERPALGRGIWRDMAWAVPEMSIVLAGNGPVRAVIGAPWEGWQPFDPIRIEQLPNLARFGVSYEPYARALAGSLREPSSSQAH